MKEHYAVIFSSQRSSIDQEGYEATAQLMVELAEKQPGFLGIESSRDTSGFGITVSYWQDLESIKQWKAQTDHQLAQKLGQERWYEAYELKIAKVLHAYGHPSDRS